MGFPFQYGPHILQCIAYNQSDVFPVSLNVPLENRIGFYGVRIDFPQETPQTFTVGFILSNNLITQNTANASFYTLDFPAYPSLTKTAVSVNVSIALRGAQYAGGTVENLTYWSENLPAFSYTPANVTFLMSDGQLKLFDIKELAREIVVNELGEIAGSDAYYAVSKELVAMNITDVVLPSNASNPSAQDLFGRPLSGSDWINKTTGRYRINFALPWKNGEAIRFTVKYELPSQIYINTQTATNVFNFSSIQFRNVTCYIEKTSIVFALPEGARILDYGNFSIGKGAFQQSLTLNQAGVSPLDEPTFSMNIAQVAYEYNPLWLSFRPTLWMFALAIVGCTTVAAWKRPQPPTKVAPPKVTMRIQPEFVKSFVDEYEEKRKTMLDLESLESKMQKGKIPRRRYKVQKKILETKLNSLSRSVDESKQRMRASRGQYADLLGTLEVAETEINEVEGNIKSIEARHGRGDLSLESYRKLLGDYQRRREKADTTIDGILLRLREESR
jgi:hypothetical protein